ncbi:MAG: hypothetical protein ACQEXQ_15110 [Bacillota bacterium]
MEKKNISDVKEQVHKKNRKIVMVAVFLLFILIIGVITIGNFAKNLGNSNNLMG